MSVINFLTCTFFIKYCVPISLKLFLKNWLRRISTIDYIGLWEQLHNSNFNLVEFDQIKTEYGKNSFAMSPTQWIKRTNSIGIIAKGGRYSIGTFTSERIVKLNDIAKKQLQLLKNNSSVRRLEKMDEHLKLE